MNHSIESAGPPSRRGQPSLPSRRQVLKGIGLAALGLTLGPSSSTSTAGATPAPDRLAQRPTGAEGPNVDARSMGARGDGRTDDTAALQAALRAAAGGRLTIGAGRYRVNPDYATGGSLRPESNSEILLADGAVLEAIPSRSAFTSVLLLRGVDRVAVRGGAFVGERATHRGAGGEQGHLINVIGCADIVLADLQLSDAWGDGAILAYDEGSRRVCQRVEIRRVAFRHNRRQGLSIVGANAVIVADCTMEGTQGADPSAGADIEPDDPWTVSDVTFERCAFRNNAGSGLQVTGLGSPGRCRDIRVRWCEATGNGRSGVALFETDAVEVDGLRAWDNRDFGLHAVTSRKLRIGSTTLTNNDRGNRFVDESTRAASG